jgi:hypothetical protein
MLQAFIGAGQRIVMRMMGLSPEAPAQDGVSGDQQDNPGFTPNAGQSREAAVYA